MINIPFDNRYVALGDSFYVRTNPDTVDKPTLIRFNEALADILGISADEPDKLAAVFSGNAIPEGAEPIAMAYAGHQFGHFVPQLGDGRAILLGEVNGADGVHYGLHFKGSGQTYYSRNGDGRAALGPVLREYLVSEAMSKFNVPTTRALAAVTTGEQVARETMLPGGIITRVASSFVRVGTFEYFAANNDVQSVQALADHVIANNYPSVSREDNPYLALLQTVVDRQASLIAQWMSLGFIHGVMNTDNMSIAGETIDYGPCAFIDAYTHDKVFSSIDRYGRYAYNNQPGIGLWNLTRLAESLLPLLADDLDAGVDVAQQVLETYIATYEKQWLAVMRNKFGLTACHSDTEDKALIESLFNLMHDDKADFTLVFHKLSQLDAVSGEKDAECRNLFGAPVKLDDWLIQWRGRLQKENRSDDERQSSMQAVNPVYIPRNHQIEAAIRAAEDQGDFSKFHELYEVLQHPFEQQVGKEEYELPPKPDEEVKYTFCGT